MDWWAKLATNDSVTVIRPPGPLADPVSHLVASLEKPESYPPLARIFTPSDRVVLAPDRFFCRSSELLAPILRKVGEAGVRLHQITFLLAEPEDEEILLDKLPEEFEEATITVHEPADPRRNAIVAHTVAGKRLALARVLVEADQILVAGKLGLHAHSGWVGGASQLWPTLAEKQPENSHTWKFGTGLRPDDSVELQEQKEACWLIGAPFFIMALPGAEHGITQVISGSDDALALARAKHLEEWAVPAHRDYARGVAVWSSAQKQIEFSEIVDTACRLGESLQPGKEIAIDVGTRFEQPASLKELRSGEFLHGERMARIWSKIISRNPVYFLGDGSEVMAKVLGASGHRKSFESDSPSSGQTLILENGAWR